MNTRSCSASMEHVDHAVPAPVRGLESFAQGMGFHVHFSLPVQSSKARTIPRPVYTLELSALEARAILWSEGVLRKSFPATSIGVVSKAAFSMSRVFTSSAPVRNVHATLS